MNIKHLLKSVAMAAIVLEVAGFGLIWEAYASVGMSLVVLGFAVCLLLVWLDYRVTARAGQEGEISQA